MPPDHLDEFINDLGTFCLQVDVETLIRTFLESFIKCAYPYTFSPERECLSSVCAEGIAGIHRTV